MGFLINTNWTCPFPFEGLSGIGFPFHASKKERPDQTPHNAASDLGLRCLPLSHKKDTSGLYKLKTKSNFTELMHIHFKGIGEGYFKCFFFYITV